MQRPRMSLQLLRNPLKLNKMKTYGVYERLYDVYERLCDVYERLCDVCKRLCHVYEIFPPVTPRCHPMHKAIYNRLNEWLEAMALRRDHL